MSDMQRYDVTGMSCAACQARVEKAVNKVEGVTSCAVSLLTNSMSVEGNAKEVDIIRAVENAGYGARVAEKVNGDRLGSTNNEVTGTENSNIKESRTLRNRLISSIVLVLILMYFSMGHMMWNWPIPAWFEGNYVACGLVQLLLATSVMVINQKFFINGFKGIIHGAPNMDTLVALGSAASWIYSVWMLFLMSDAMVKGLDASQYMKELYFESAAMILALITVGKLLEARSKGRTADALNGLIKLAPKNATLIIDGIENVVDITHAKEGDIFVVKPGESIPLDGIVLEGNSAIDESALTGESIPVDKAPGDEVSAATINQSGFIKCKATRVGDKTMLAQIIRLVSDASATKAPIAKIADKVSGIFVPVVIGIAVATFAIWMLLGAEIGYALARAISVLVISCPCALGLATPVAIMVGSGVGAKHGILYKNAAALELVGKTKIVALDKTGTITKGKLEVKDVIAVDITKGKLLGYACSLEAKSEHPLAGAIVQYGKERNVQLLETTGFEAIAGNGLQAVIEGQRIYGGSKKYISSLVDITRHASQIEELENQGKTVVMFAMVDITQRAMDNSDEEGEARLIGIVALADQIKDDAVSAVQEIKQQGIKVVMLTGDNKKTAKAIGNIVGVDDVMAEILPQDKEAAIRELKKQGHVVMVGDGINDAPALTTADTGIAIGAGTDIAIDAADIVLLKDGLKYVPAAIRLGRATLKNIKENLFWAFIYNIIGIPLAAGAYVKLFGWSMNPMFGAAAMSLSSFCVITNALRLNLFKVLGNNKSENGVGVKTDEAGEAADTNREELEKENITMTKTMKIEGMMCGHCEARVKKTLEAIEGVTEAIVSHETGTAVVNSSVEISAETLKDAVTEQGYEVITVE